MRLDLPSSCNDKGQKWWLRVFLDLGVWSNITSAFETFGSMKGISHLDFWSCCDGCLANGAWAGRCLQEDFALGANYYGGSSWLNAEVWTNIWEMKPAHLSDTHRIPWGSFPETGQSELHFHGPSVASFAELTLASFVEINCYSPHRVVPVDLTSKSRWVSYHRDQCRPPWMLLKTVAIQSFSSSSSSLWCFWSAKPKGILDFLVVARMSKT